MRYRAITEAFYMRRIAQCFAFNTENIKAKDLRVIVAAANMSSLHHAMPIKLTAQRFTNSR